MQRSGLRAATTSVRYAQDIERATAPRSKRRKPWKTLEEGSHETFDHYGMPGHFVHLNGLYMKSRTRLDQVGRFQSQRHRGRNMR